MASLKTWCVVLSMVVRDRGPRGCAAAGACPSRPRHARARRSIPTGVWVSVVTEDWRWRMVTPAKGDVLGIPLNPQGLQIARAWDYVKDVAAGNECKAYGAGGIMRMPTRLRIGWQDDDTLKIETDAGQQTRLLFFDTSRQPSGPRTLQGHSVAEWTDVFTGGGRGARGGGTRRAAVRHRRHPGRDHEPARWLSAQERRAIQSERHRHRVPSTACPDPMARSGWW